ncbi:hypothetical protein H8K20_08145 [Neobittarella massiliensis]|uniref:DUF6273 domain-containing protein n=1 Tax=Neobittarella massiliensis (ex Bilen et al. 2018) TaxID=2041842 RepID=A0A8J6IFV0_9FIRM|nr:DUF6273 domain-containing protein [Neobittarella massiliensis]MBC3516365.1 hypothetical protein [Neobittarella massiliensis]
MGRWQLLKDRPLGTAVSFSAAHQKYPLNETGTPITWILVRKESGKLFLLSKYILCQKAVDGKESSRVGGNNAYGSSNIDQWLNATAANWYTARHSTDAPPSAGNVTQNPYQSEPGFLSGFSAPAQSMLVAHSLPGVKMAASSGESFKTAKVFLPSQYNLGLYNYDAESTAEGETWPYFESSGQSVTVAKTGINGVAASYWMRTPEAGGNDRMTFVDAVGDGYFKYANANDGSKGIRPCIVIADNATVDTQFDPIDSVYPLYVNDAPAAPTTLSTGLLLQGRPVAINWPASVGSGVSYTLQRSVDGGSFTELVTGLTDTTYTDIVPVAASSYQVRVCAVSARGYASVWKTMDQQQVIVPAPPVISGSDADWGELTAPNTYRYTVTSTSATAMKVTERLVSSGNEMLLRSYVVQPGEENTVQWGLTEWMQLADGSHSLVITAADGTFTTVRTLCFSRTVPAVELSRAIATDAVVSKVFLSVFPTPVGDAAVTCLVSNNPFDQQPVWENCAHNLNLSVHNMQNTTCTGGGGIAYRLKIQKNTADVALDRIVVRFV